MNEQREGGKNSTKRNETEIQMFWHEKDIGKSNYIAS